MPSERPGWPLINVAMDIVSSKGENLIYKFGEGTDLQHEVCISWENGKFDVEVTRFSNPVYYPGGLYDPPETRWAEEGDTFEEVKIVEVYKRLKQDWGIKLVPDRKVYMAEATNG